MQLRMMPLDQKPSSYRVQFRWGPIFSGAFATLGFGLFFLLLGNALGLSIYNAVSPTVVGALKLVSWIYMMMALVFSYYAGAMVGTRSSEVFNFVSGGLHGLVSWAFASVLGVILASNQSTLMRQVLDGTGPNSGNWLAICVVGFGFCAAIMGGTSGKETTSYTRMEEEAGDLRRSA